MPIKKVSVEVKQGNGFKTECRTGNHLVVIDQPTASGGTNEGPTPLEVQLMALGACITAIGWIIANQRNLVMRGITVAVEGELDTDGLMGKPSKNRVGFGTITARVKIDTDLPEAEQEQFLHEIDERCPISDILIDPTPVQIVLER